MGSLDESKKALEKIQGKYLTFKLAEQEYGLEILRVREIIGLMDITKLPKTPDFVKGVINLRGKVIPVIDLRLRFGLEEEKHTDKTCIIVVDISKDSELMQIGIIVDSVSEVLNVMLDDLEPTPKFGISIETDYILGMAKGKDSVRTLLDIDKVVTANEINNVLEPEEE
jgi:purine-binding chemotaxis protein CheW